MEGSAQLLTLGNMMGLKVSEVSKRILDNMLSERLENGM